MAETAGAPNQSKDKADKSSQGLRTGEADAVNADVRRRGHVSLDVIDEDSLFGVDTRVTAFGRRTAGAPAVYHDRGETRHDQKARIQHGLHEKR
jgi:hypothetical protein